MVRLSKQTRRRHISYKRPSVPGIRTGARQDALTQGYKPHANAITGELAQSAFIPRIK